MGEKWYNENEWHSLEVKNVKNPNRTKGLIKCKCGSSRIEASISKDDCESWRWINVKCKACGNWLYYNGA